MAAVISLPANQPPQRFYRGGKQIADFRGHAASASHEPEDWIGSVTTVSGEREAGLSRLPDGRRLRDAVEADPVAWLGPAHVARWGTDVRLLVKLLDAGQRLPVHAHPSDEFAARHLGHAHGKAEAWFILRGGEIHLGLRKDIAPADLAHLVRAQDSAALLGLLHRVSVAPGDVVWVPPGELHAIGAGVFLLELQQPEDLSILLEWTGFDLNGARDGHLGLGFETALRAVNVQARTDDELATLVRAAPPDGSVFPPESEQFFRLHRHSAPQLTTLEAGFAVGVVTRGELVLGGRTVRAGSTLLLPHDEGAVELSGAGEILLARPPVP